MKIYSNKIQLNINCRKLIVTYLDKCVRRKFNYFSVGFFISYAQYLLISSQ